MSFLTSTTTTHAGGGGAWASLFFSRTTSGGEGSSGGGGEGSSGGGNAGTVGGGEGSSRGGDAGSVRGSCNRTCTVQAAHSDLAYALFHEVTLQQSLVRSGYTSGVVGGWCQVAGGFCQVAGGVPCGCSSSAGGVPWGTSSAGGVPWGTLSLVGKVSAGFSGWILAPTEVNPVVAPAEACCRVVLAAAELDPPDAPTDPAWNGSDSSPLNNGGGGVPPLLHYPSTLQDCLNPLSLLFYKMCGFSRHCSADRNSSEW